MNFSNIVKDKKGFTFLELIWASGILFLGLMAVANLILQNIRVQGDNKNRLVASMLAQEGLELVRNQRDTNWLTSGASWDDDIIFDGSYRIDARHAPEDNVSNVADLTTQSNAHLYIDSDGFYVHTTTATSTPFFRIIVVDTGNPDYLSIKSAVHWKERGVLKKYEAVTYLYDWY